MARNRWWWAPTQQKAEACVHRAAAVPAGLATLVETAPEGEWSYEIKFDGYRIMARIDHGKVKLFTRNGHDWTARMPLQAKALASLGLSSAWLDGEVVVANAEGIADFQALQNAFDALSASRRSLNLPTRTR